MENYVKFKLVGGKIKLKKGVVPHKFGCQKGKTEVLKKSKFVKRRWIESCENRSNDMISSDSVENFEFIDCGNNCNMVERERGALKTEIYVKEIDNKNGKPTRDKCVQVKLKIKLHRKP